MLICSALVSEGPGGEDDEEREDEQVQVGEAVFRAASGRRCAVLLEACAQGDHRAGVEQPAAEDHRSERKSVMFLENGL